MDKEEQIQKARDITQTRILTQDEFKQVRRRQLQKQVQFDAQAHKKGKKRNSEDIDRVNTDDVTLSTDPR